MARQMGVLEAKTAFSALVADVERTGEEVTVTRHGKPAVRIVPAHAKPDSAKVDWAERVERIKALRAKQPFVPGFDDLSWEELKRVAHGEDRYD